MLFKIHLRCLDERPILPLNYQYELSSWIYRVIGQADAAYADFLHEQGYRTDRRSFKLFSFSHLEVPKYRIQGDRMEIQSRYASFKIGFYVDRTAEEFVRGLFQDQLFRLGDRRSQVAFQVETVEMRSLQLPEGPVHIRMRSPLLIGERMEGSDTDTYLHPTDPPFGPLLYRNLVGKYLSVAGALPPEWTPDQFLYRPLPEREARSKLIHLKVDKKEHTQVRGWLFDFELNAPRPLLELGLLAGFGKGNAQGFGFGEIFQGERQNAGGVGK